MWTDVPSGDAAFDQYPCVVPLQRFGRDKRAAVVGKMPIEVIAATAKVLVAGRWVGDANEKAAWPKLVRPSLFQPALPEPGLAQSQFRSVEYYQRTTMKCLVVDDGAPSAT